MRGYGCRIVEERRASRPRRARPGARRGARSLPLALLALALVLPAAAQKTPESPAPPVAGAGRPRAEAPPARDQQLPAVVEARQALSAILGRPTADSVSLNLLAASALEACVSWWPSDGAESAASRGATVALAAGAPAEVTLSGLARDREYRYRLLSRKAGAASWTAGPEGRFRTQRAPGSAFSFEVIGDSHPERAQQFSADLYAQVLGKAAADRPDFFMTIGDDFSVDTLRSVTKETVDAVYRRQRLYLSIVGAVSPLFLVNGNHEQASLANLDGTAANVAVWAQNSRNAYFPQPAPDSFYSGDAAEVAHVGPLRDYYAFTWGDALFMVIDPYWHSPKAVDNAFGGGEKTRDLWRTTLGEEQYAWFRSTLEASPATFKFVFAHHVNGTGRGGVEVAPFYEWGGASPGGKDDFAARRPGWAAPLHDLMAKNKVTAFVQGHDHLFASQVLDGVAYITLPEPADPNYVLYNAEAFTSGDKLPNSGRVRFTVDAGKVLVEYLRDWLPADLPAGVDPAKPAYAFTITAGGTPSPGTFDEAQRAGAPVPAARSAEISPAAGRKPPAGAVRPDGGRQGGSSASSAPAPSSPQPSAPPQPAGELGLRTLVEYPGTGSVSLATAFDLDAQYYYEYGPEGGGLDRHTPASQAKAGSVARDRLEDLEPGSTYTYRLVWAPAGSATWSRGEAGRFATAKAPGASFTFAIEADPHFDENSDGPAYLATLARMAADRPDFIVDLGDTSMAEKLARDPAAYVARNRLVRSYWDEIGGSAPFLMVLGNHDGEHGWPAGKTQPTTAEAAAIRETWLLDAGRAPSPAYDRFSDTAWALTWGDSLLVALDPFAAETAKPGEDGWEWTLGKTQYDWLSSVLARSKSAYKFVFTHNLPGGTGKDARGGADYAGLYEWGGHSPSGEDEFAVKRRGWSLPIHDLLLQYGVDAVFRGHDHFYAREERDGIVYQLVPQPSLARAPRLDTAQLEAYGYTKGDFLPDPGYLRVSVSPAAATVEYVAAADGRVLRAYSFAPDRNLAKAER